MATYGKKKSSSSKSSTTKSATKSTTKWGSISSSQAKSLISKAKAQGINTKQVGSAMKKLGISVSSWGSSNQNKSTTPPVDTSKVTGTAGNANNQAGAAPTTKTLTASQQKTIQNSYGQLVQKYGAKKAGEMLKSQLDKGWYDSSFVSKISTWAPEASNQPENKAAIDFATKNPWAANPFSTASDWDIAWARFNDRTSSRIDMLKKMFDNRASVFGEEWAKKIVEAAAKRLGIDPSQVFGWDVKEWATEAADYGALDAKKTIKKFTELNPSDTNFSNDLNAAVDENANALTSDIQSEQDAMNYIKSENKEVNNIINSFYNNAKTAIDNLSKYTDTTSKNMANVIQNRLSAAETGFQDVTAQLEDLRNKANGVFDQNVARQRQIRAQQLADAWIITQEQAGQAAAYSLQDYVAEANLKKAEIEQSISEQMTNAIKEKNALIDQIYQQQGIDENTKQQQAAQITSMYNTLLTAQGNTLAEVKAKYGDKVLGMFANQIGRDQEVNAPSLMDKVTEAQRTAANTNATSRFNTIKTVVQDIDANILPFIMDDIAVMQQSGWFMQGDVLDVIAKLIAKWKKELLAANK